VSKPRRPLRLVGAKEAKLGRATIMDRALAQRYGAPYVHLAAFAIDVDRVHRLETERSTLPFGWEVFLTEMRLAAFMDEAKVDPAQLFEDMCLSVMDLPAARENQGALGAQLPFAIYVAVAHQHLPARVGACFRAWKKPPVELIEETAQLAAQAGLLARLAQHCLAATLEPPLVEPVRAALEALAVG
jgi:hypothetical protein